ncbi:hypothetical protein TWF730_005939 [Orbilia blumenaviensis]|uniref:Ferric oxidoreductase domain-containing protein n=1 Tax=Orbilia blumenaviensis TaxID=1796055 RepID=A0AAV9VJV0_9PEZI
MSRHLAIGALFAAILPRGAIADGYGLIGWGKTMYDPPCTFACRGVISKCPLLCTPKDSAVNHGSHHNPVSTPPECFTSDPAFLRTMALCINTYCPTSDAPALSKIEDYWYSHLGTGSIGNYQYVPVISYTEALIAAREDERKGVQFPNNTSTSIDEHGNHNMLRARIIRRNGDMNTLPTIKSKQPLNVTSVISASDWKLEYNGLLNFETNEKGHSTYTIILMLIALFLPVILSLLRFVPGLKRSKWWSYFNSVLNYPALWGSNHREPVAMIAGGGLVPTRGQSMYIALISVLNIAFLVGPYVYLSPQRTFGSRSEQNMSVMGCRAGALALGNMVAMFVFSSRNNVLLYITGWSHSTFLLLHRWLGYWTIIQTVLHSILLLAYYNKYGDYASELVRLYWIWGIVGTVAAVAIWPFSLLIVRQKAYEFFYFMHIVLIILFLVGYYYHIWYVFEYRWGYEIWAFIAIGIWGKDRIWRAGQMIYHGWRTAKITSVEGSNSEYLRIDIDGVHAEGVVYLCFPTLGLNFWQTHPFSVVSSFARHGSQQATTTKSILQDSEKQAEAEITIASPNQSDTASTSSVPPAEVVSRASIVIRTRTGITSRLAARLAMAGSELRLPVLIEGPYHSNVSSQLSQCTTLVCIAGGVGITGVLPHLHQFGSPRHGRLYWSMRDTALRSGLATEIADLPASIQVEISAGKRLDIESIIREELAGRTGDGLVGIIVCGPAGLADDVRKHATGMTSRGTTRAPYILIDEAFSW